MRQHRLKVRRSPRMVRKIRLLRRRTPPARPRRLERRRPCVSRVHRHRRRRRRQLRSIHLRRRRLRYRRQPTHLRRHPRRRRLRARCRSRRLLRTSQTLRAARAIPRARAGRESLRRLTPSRRRREASVRRKIGRTVRRSAASRKRSASAAILRATTYPRALRQLSNRSHRADGFVQRQLSARALLTRDGQDFARIGDGSDGDGSDAMRWLHDRAWKYGELRPSNEAGLLHGLFELQYRAMRCRVRAGLPHRVHWRRRRSASDVRAVDELRTCEDGSVSPLPCAVLRYSRRVSLSA